MSPRPPGTPLSCLRRAHLLFCTSLPLSRLGCPLSLKTPNMGNVGKDVYESTTEAAEVRLVSHGHVACDNLINPASSILATRPLVSTMIVRRSSSATKTAHFQETS